MSTLIVTILLIAAASGLVFFFAKQKKADNTSPSDINSKSTAAEIEALDKALTSVFERLDSMKPLSEQIEIEQVLSTEKAKLAEGIKKRKEIEAGVYKAREDINSQEQKLAEMKKGQVEAAKLVDQLNANKEVLQSELMSLESQLANSRTQMSDLQTEIELSSTQIEKLNEITTTINEASSRLRELSDAHKLSTDRFINLQNQYQELEKEYAKLIKKELSPD